MSQFKPFRSGTLANSEDPDVDHDLDPNYFTL